MHLRGELEIITNNLQNAILENKVLASVDFGYTQRIDPLLLKRIVDRLNRKTQNDPNIIILDDMIISEPALAASKQAFFDLLNESKTYVILFHFTNFLLINLDLSICLL